MKEMALVLVLLGLGCVPKETPEQESARRRAAAEKYSKEQEAFTAHFPDVRIGMSFADLERQIEGRRLHMNEGGKSGHYNIQIEHTSEFGDVKSIMYSVNKGFSRGYLRQEYVTVTVRRGIVVGYSK
jgi:hypothetical protein